MYGANKSVLLPMGNATPESWWLAGGVSAANCVAAYQAKGKASLSDSYINLANSGTYNAAPGTAPSFNTSTGWTFNGTSQYLTTGITPAGSYTAIVAVSSWGSSVNGAYLFGAYNSLSSNFGIYRDTATIGYQVNGTLVVNDTTTNGVFCIAGKTGYKNSVSQGSIAAGGSDTSRTIYIGVVNTTGSSPNFNFGAAVTIKAFAIYNTTLSSSQISAITTAMNAL